MTLNKIKGDIFSQIGYSIAFAVDATYKCDVGICKQLDDRFRIETLLKSLPEEATKWKGRGYCVAFTSGTQDLYALVVKSLPQKYPDYNNIKEALMSLAADVSRKNSILTPKIAMPKICCGSYDKRDWDKIESLIFDAFRGIDCEILIVEKD